MWLITQRWTTKWLLSNNWYLSLNNSFVHNTVVLSSLSWYWTHEVDCMNEPCFALFLYMCVVLFSSVLFSCFVFPVQFCTAVTRTALNLILILFSLSLKILHCAFKIINHQNTTVCPLLFIYSTSCLCVVAMTGSNDVVSRKTARWLSVTTTQQETNNWHAPIWVYWQASSFFFFNLLAKLHHLQKSHSKSMCTVYTIPNIHIIIWKPFLFK